jgi:hypothetical protein
MFELSQSTFLKINGLFFLFRLLNYLSLFMVETLLSGIILGLLIITILGLFFTAYLQYIRSDSKLIF